MSDESSKTLLVDGNNLLIRSVRAMQATGLSADGVATGPLVSFINSMSKYVRQIRPSVVVVCWDGGRSSHRTAIYSDYKAGRQDHPSDVREFQDSAFALAKGFLTLANVYQVQVVGVEADDLIAQYWRKPWLSPLWILSSDKDLLQLVIKDECTQIRLGQADEIWDEDRVVRELGCTPRQWSDVLALAGDAVDGVPGVPRVGVKTACKDLAKFNWNISKLLESGPDRYVLNSDLVARNIKLVNLRDHPHPVSLQDPPMFAPTNPDSILWDDLLEMVDDLKLASIGSRMRIGNFWGS